jgi:flagellin-like protein
MKEKMKNFRRSKKALSPVVASIILIAVTVAVSIAVAAWMGALTIGFMGGSEQVEIRTITFTSGQAALVIKNTGTSAVTIQEVYVNNALQANTAIDPDAPFSIPANGQQTLTVTLSWVAGDNYQFKVVTAKGNPFMKNAIPPS